MELKEKFIYILKEFKTKKQKKKTENNKNEQQNQKIDDRN